MSVEFWYSGPFEVKNNPSFHLRLSISCYFIFDSLLNWLSLVSAHVQAPTLIIHGTEDEVIDFSAGLQLYERCPKPVDPLWVEGAGHNDIELYAVYLDRLKSFLENDIANKWDGARCYGDSSIVIVTPLWFTNDSWIYKAVHLSRNFGSVLFVSIDSNYIYSNNDIFA